MQCDHKPDSGPSHTAFKWITLVEKQTNVKLYPFVILQDQPEASKVHTDCSKRSSIIVLSGGRAAKTFAIFLFVQNAYLTMTNDV